MRTDDARMRSLTNKVAKMVQYVRVVASDFTQQMREIGPRTPKTIPTSSEPGDATNVLLPKKRRIFEPGT